MREYNKQYWLKHRPPPKPKKEKAPKPPKKERVKKEKPPKKERIPKPKKSEWYEPPEPNYPMKIERGNFVLTF